MGPAVLCARATITAAAVPAVAVQPTPVVPGMTTASVGVGLTPAAVAEAKAWLPIVKTLAQHSGKAVLDLELNRPQTFVAFMSALLSTDLKPQDVPAHISHKKLAILLRGKLLEHIKDVYASAKKAQQPGKDAEAYKQEVSELAAQASDLALIAPFFYEDARSMIQKTNGILHDVVLPNLNANKAFQEAAAQFYEAAQREKAPDSAEASAWLPVVKTLSLCIPGLDLSQPETSKAFARVLKRTDIKADHIPNNISDKEFENLLRDAITQYTAALWMQVIEANDKAQQSDSAAYEKTWTEEYKKEILELAAQASDLSRIETFLDASSRSMVNKTIFLLHKIDDIKVFQAGRHSSASLAAAAEARPEKSPPAVDKIVEKGRALADAEFDALADGLSKDLSLFKEMISLEWTPHHKEKLRSVFLESHDPQVKEGLFLLFKTPAFGFVGLRDMVRWLYPEYEQEILEFYPGIPDSPAAFDEFKLSILNDPALLRASIENLRALKSSSPEQHKALLNGLHGGLPSEARFAFLMAGDKFIKRERGSAYYGLGKTYYLPYALKGDDAKVLSSAKPELVTARLRVPDPKKVLAQKQRYAIFDRLINANFQVLQSMSAHAEEMTRFSAKRILKRTGRLSELFARLKPSPRRVGKAKAAFSSIERRLRERWAQFGSDELLPEELVKRMFELKQQDPRGRLHSLINWIHQKALEVLGASGYQSSDRSGKLDKAGSYLNFIYLGDAPLHEVLQRNPALKALWSRLDRIRSIDDDTLLLSEDRLWLHSKLGCHSAEIFADVSDPDEGGMLRIRYKESGYKGSYQRLLVISSFLKQLGIPSEISGKDYLTVSWDKDHGLSSQRALIEAYPFIIQLLRDLGNVDLLFGHYKDDFGEQEASACALKLGRIYAAEGGWPFAIDNGDHALADDLRHYEEKEPRQRALAEKLNAELARLNLPPIPAEIPFGQRTIERFFRQPIEEAAGRGELEWDGEHIPQPKPYAPVDALVEAALSDEGQSTARAAVLSTLEGSVLDYEPIGKAGALSAERAQLRLDDGFILTVHALRDPASGRLAYAQASTWRAGIGRAIFISAEELLRRLRDSGYPAELGESLSAAQQAQLQNLLKARIARQSSEQAETFGLPASPGRGESVVGPILFDKASLVEGGVLTVPYTDPDDIEAISRAAGVLATGGGSLSHAAITTRELGLPSVILYSASWKSDSQGRPALGLRLNKPSPPRKVKGDVEVARLEPVQDPVLREGDLVRMNGITGRVTLLERAGNGPIQQAYRALERLRSGAVQELEWTQDRPLKAERFILEEARSNPRYSAQKGLIFEVLGRSAKHLSDKDRSVLAAASTDAAADDASAQQAGPSESKVRKPLWRRLEKKLEQSADKDRLMALLRRMIRRDGPKAGADPAYQRLLELDRKDREEKLLEKTSEEPAFLDLESIDDDMKPLVGGKSAKLGEMFQALSSVAPAKAGAQGGVYLDPGLRRDDDPSVVPASVPEGLALTIHAYKRFLKETGLEDKVRALAMELDALLSAPGMDEAGRSKEIGRLSERIRQVLMSGKLDIEKGVGRDILEALKKHGFEDQSARWSVRSSAIQEDSDDAAFAGAAESYLNLKPDEVLSKVVENWASFWLPRGILYRQRQGLRSVDLLPATLIQKMSGAHVSGVIFTRNPVNGKDEVVLNAAYGLGEGVVSGKAAADVYTTRKQDGEETQLPHVARKLWRVEPKPDGTSGTRLGLVPKALRDKRALTRAQTRALARVAVAIEKRFGKAMDIEFTIYQGRIVILQARPITTR